MKRQTVSSSNVKSIGFENSILEVEFLNGRIYQYYGVPESIYLLLMNAASKGSFLASNVFNKFDYKEI